MRRIDIGMAFVTLAISAGLALGPVAVQAAEDDAEAKGRRVVLHLGSESDKKLLFHPDRIVLEAGARYTLVIVNPSLEVHEFDAPDLVAAVWSSGVKVLEGIGESARPVAQVMGKPAEIEVLPGGSVEWTFVPVVAGSYDMLCDIQDQSGKTHTEMGMKGVVVVK